ncbi:MAG TPA: hypothetical protein VIP78_08600 [Candidatus Dormibacteraeota bacterium]
MAEGVALARRSQSLQPWLAVIAECCDRRRRWAANPRFGSSLLRSNSAIFVTTKPPRHQQLAKMRAARRTQSTLDLREQFKHRRRVADRAGWSFALLQGGQGGEEDAE